LPHGARTVLLVTPDLATQLPNNPIGLPKEKGRSEMKKISNAAGTFLTGTALADAIMEYATALWNQRRVAFVDIPFVNGQGVIERAQFLIGWANQIATVSAGTVGAELREPETERVLRSEARRTIGVINAQPVESPDYRVFGPYEL
jgi:hypothetical protein